MMGLSLGGRTRRFATARFSLIPLFLLCAQTQAQYAYAFEDLDQIRVSEPGPCDWSASLIRVGAVLTGDAADSPIADDLGDERYGKLGLTVAYRF